MSKTSKTGWFIVGAFVLGGLADDDEPQSVTHVPTTVVHKTTRVLQEPAPVLKQSTKPDTQIKTSSLPKSVLKQVTTSAPQPTTQPVQRYQPKSMYVDASRLNVRTGPAKTNKVIWTLKRDQKITVTNKEGDWLYVEGTRFKGWVFGTYLTNNPAPQQASLPAPKKTNSLSVSAIKKILIKRSHAYYSGNCPCPYNITAAGRRCGKRSAWSRPGGASPLCYNRDVTAGMVADYRARQ